MFPLLSQCRALLVSRSGYHRWLKHQACVREKARQVLTEQIASTFQASRCLYGSPRVYQDLRARNIRVCENTVVRRIH